MSATSPLTYESYDFDSRYYIQTAKNNVTSFAHVIAEAITNSDEAIARRAARGANPTGAIRVSYDPGTFRLHVTDDGDGMDTERMRDRLKRIGAEPALDSKRGFFHRGIREVFIAMGSSVVESITVDGGRPVYTRAVFDPQNGMAIEVSDGDVTDDLRTNLGIAHAGTRLTIPLKRLAMSKPRLFTFPMLCSQIENCVQVRPVLLDPEREVTFEYGQTPPRRIRFAYPKGETLVPHETIQVADLPAVLWAAATDKPIKEGGKSKQNRRYGILIRGQRAAYEVSLGDSLSNYPSFQQLFGELRIDGIEEKQREADVNAADDAELIYKADRSGLNADHPISESINECLDKVLGPLLAALEAKEKKKSVTSDVRRRLSNLARIINKAVEGVKPGDIESATGAPSAHAEKASNETTAPDPPAERIPPEVPDGIAFAYDRIFVPAGGIRTVKVWFDTAKIPPGTSVLATVDPGGVISSASLSQPVVPTPPPHGIAELSLAIEADEAEGRQEVVVSSASYVESLPVHVRFQRASGFISQIIPVEKDWESGSAFYDPSTGRVSVYVGRPEFQEAARLARREKYDDPFKFPLYSQLIVESVREAALRTAAERLAEVAWDELPSEERQERDAFSRLVIVEYYALDYKLRNSLLKAFVYE